LRANDTEAVLAGGVLTFKKSDGITMESEELTIAPFKVEVAYQFRNTNAADITTRVAFPMAPYTSVEDQNTWEAIETETERKKYWQAFGHFTVTVDGKAVRFETIADVAPDAATVTVTHHWVQTFPAGKTLLVRHTFQPRGSFLYDRSYEDERFAALPRDYCVGPALIKAMKRREFGGITQVHYILKTGANWKGPIGKFVLRIQKEKASDKSSLCLDGFKKVDARTFVLEKTNYVPTQDLKVAFIRYND